MSNPQAAPTLAQARAAVDALRSGYMTSTERALADLAMSLAQELDATRRDAMVAGSVLASASLATGATVQLAPLGDNAGADAMRHEIEGLRAQLAAQRSAMQQLNRDLDAVYRRDGLVRGTRSEMPPVVDAPPRRHHTLEDFAANLPDFGDSSSLNPSQSHSQALAHLSQPRVRPQDIQLSAEDIARNTQRPRRLAAHQHLAGFTPGEPVGAAPLGLLVAVAVIAIILLVALL